MTKQEAIRKAKADRTKTDNVESVKEMFDKQKRDKIMASYKLHDDDSISTERLLQMVADDCGCEIDEVVNVLAESEEG